MKKISIIIPAYNEGNFIGELLEKIIRIDIASVGFSKEIIVVDDCSTDNTSLVVKNFDQVRLLINEKNFGKGRSVQKGIKEATGDYILVQDADLEYYPEDYIPMLKELKGDVAVVYGSRILGQIKENGVFPFPGKHPEQAIGPWVANWLLSLTAFLIYFKWITDTLTAYKIYPRFFFTSTEIKTKGFETDHEITAKLIRKNFKIVEVPIKYDPRTKEEGKKIRASDFFKAIITFLRFRFLR